jgi:hypothetical protein
MTNKFDDAKYQDKDELRVRLYRVDGDEMTFEQIKQHCPHVTEKMLRDRLFRGERKMARLSRPPDTRKSVDKPKSWR